MRDAGLLINHLGCGLVLWQASCLLQPLTFGAVLCRYSCPGWFSMRIQSDKSPPVTQHPPRGHRHADTRSVIAALPPFPSNIDLSPIDSVGAPVGLLRVLSTTPRTHVSLTALEWAIVG